MRKAVIVAGNILTPLGDLQATWENLLAGKSGLTFRSLGAGAERWPLGVIEDLSGVYGSWQRLQSMFDRLLCNLPPLPEKTALFCATTKAAVDELITAESDDASGQPWQVAGYLARRLALQGRTKTVSAACVSSLIAMIQGAVHIRAGKCDHALVVGFDLLSEFVFSGFSSLKALSSTGAQPFDRRRSGLSLGDGAGWVLLSAEEQVAPGEKILAYLDSWAISCDATHITAPCRNASGLTAVLEQIGAQSSCSIGGINAHGTGTIYNDAMELLAFRKNCDAGTPLCSVKGALGHSLAAAGIVETLLSVRSLQDLLLPPTVGLAAPEESNCSLSGEGVLPLLSPSVLTCNSGFGGINAALLLTRK